jgi:hypothetical protein
MYYIPRYLAWTAYTPKYIVILLVLLYARAYGMCAVVCSEKGIKPVQATVYIYYSEVIPPTLSAHTNNMSHNDTKEILL